MAAPAYKWVFWFSFPVDLHAGTGETARRRRSKWRFLTDEVFIDSGLGLGRQRGFWRFACGASTGSYLVS
jgi:hypothetical protein